MNFRSERKALLQVLIGLWKYHLDAVKDEAEHVEVHGVTLKAYIDLLIDECEACAF